MSTEKKELNEKEQKFCYLVLEYMDNVKAYKAAFSNTNIPDHQAVAKAYRVLQRPHVKEFLANLRENLKDEHIITREQIIRGHKRIIQAWEELWELSNKPDKTKEEEKRFYLLKELVKGSNYNKAFSEISRLTGAYEPEKTEQTIKTVEINVKRNRD